MGHLAAVARVVASEPRRGRCARSYDVRAKVLLGKGPREACMGAGVHTCVRPMHGRIRGAGTATRRGIQE